VDIGAGQIFSVPPTTQVSLDILIPSEDPEVLENVIAPPDTAIRRAACRIQAKVTCVYSSSGNHAKYSEVFYLERGAPGGSVGGQFWMPEGTRSVQARFSNVADIFADLTPKGDVRAALRTESARVPQGIAVDAAYPSPNVPLTFEGGDGTSTRRTEVFPSSVWNVVRVQNPAGSAAEALHSVVCAELDL
jgi:hypothetical protein